MLDQRACCRRLLRLRADCGCEHEVLLEFGRHQTDIVHARGRHEDIADKQRQLSLAFGDCLGHLRGRRLWLDLGFHLLADAETLEHAQEMLAVDAFR